MTAMGGPTLEWSEWTNGIWTSPDGDKVPYTETVCEVDVGYLGDCYEDTYTLSIRRWPKTTQLCITVEYSFGDGYDLESMGTVGRTIRLAKLPHGEFERQKTDLLKLALEKVVALYFEENGEDPNPWPTTSNY